MKLALITLSNEGARVASHLAARCSAHRHRCRLFVHREVTSHGDGERFDRVVELTAAVFAEYEGLIYVAPTGVVVRALAPCVSHKTTDPAVVVVDVGGRWAVSLLSGHEGGANALAIEIANHLDAEPIVTTTTEALKDLIVGIGCRRGTPTSEIVAALREALALVAADPSRVRLLASVDLKADEPGLLAAAAELAIPLRVISSDEIRWASPAVTPSPIAHEKLDLPGVAEPAALLAGRRTRLILPRQVIRGLTVAIARENCLWSASAPAAASIAPPAP